MYCFYCFLILQLINYLQNSIDIATEQSFRYMELTDAKICISKMHHYIKFLQMGHIRMYTSMAEFLHNQIYGHEI